ncbi:hypothetical protein LLG95_18630 [bacterium]|nr:hypothetical protein [bacterium]
MKTADVTVYGIIEAIRIVPGETHGLNSQGHVIRTLEIKLRVLNSVPKLDETTVTFVNWADPEIKYFNVGRELIACLKRKGGRYWRNDISGIWGIFPIDGAGDKRVVRLAPHFHPVTPERAWEHVQAIYNQMTRPPDPARNRARLDILKSGAPIEAHMALEELSAPPRPAFTNADLVDALEIQYRRNRNGMSSGPYELNDLTRSLVKIVALSGDDRAVSRTLALYIEDRTDPRGPVLGYLNWDYNILRFVLKRPGPSRAACVRAVLGREAQIRDGNKKLGSTLLLPLDDTSLRLLAQTPGADIDGLLNEYLAKDAPLREEILHFRADALKHPQTGGDSDFD